MQNKEGTAGSEEYHCGASFKQEALLKGSLRGGAESEGSIPNIDSDERIEAEALQMKFKIMRQAVASSPKISLECTGRKMVSLLLWEHHQSGPAKLF